MNIGDKTYFKGIELTIITEPYAKYGAMWQDGVSETGKTFTVATPAQLAANATETQAEYNTMQAGFKRLKGLK
jgi:hypothetical protein